MPGYTDADNDRAMHDSLDACAPPLCTHVTCGICSVSVKLDTPEEDPAPRYCDGCTDWLDKQGRKKPAHDAACHADHIRDARKDTW